jgi:tetratricopeptide (TPR) repeat protein
MVSESGKVKEAIDKAREYFAGKQYKNAKLMYFQAQNHVKDSATRAIIWAELSWVYYYEKDYEKAIEAAENVLIHDASYQALDDLYRVQGYAYLGLNNYVLAEKLLSLSLEKDSKAEKQQYAKYELGKLHFIRGNYDLAYPYFRDILKFFDESKQEYALSILFYLGFIHYYLGNIKKSHDNFERILKSNPSDTRKASAYFGLSFLEFQDKNFLNVITLCEKIMTLDVEFFDRESVAFLTAASYYYLGRKDIFYEYYHQLVKTYPKGRYKEELEKLYRQNSRQDQDNKDESS